MTAYKDYSALRQVLMALSSFVRCFVHVDAKSEITETQCKELSSIPGVYAIRKYNVNWGSMAHLKAILFLLRQGLLDSDISYFHIISAQDFPVLPHSEFLKRFENEDKIYMQKLRTTDYPQLENRYRHFHFMDMLNYQDQSEKVQNWIGRIDRWQDMLHIRRSYIPESKGLVWVSMPRSAAETAVHSEQARFLLRKLQMMYIPEEFYFQNVFAETVFEQHIVSNPLRFSIWRSEESASPDVLTQDDLPDIDASGCVFARKIVVGTPLFNELLLRWKQ